jgi:hypothetical protein
LKGIPIHGSTLTPGQTKAAAIALGLLSLTLLAVAAGQWSSDRPVADDGAATRSPWRGNLILLGISVLLLGGLLLVAEELGWSRDRVLWIGMGNYLAFMTLIRPWWFWDNYRARWLRTAIGDGPTAFLYLAIAGVMVWLGVYTDWTFGRR